MAHNVSFATRRKIFNFSERYYWFMHSPWAGGVMLVVFMVLALVLGNLPATKGWYYGILQSHFTIGFDGFALSKSIEHWINDGLMVIFFFYVGLEIKREIIAGELSSPRQAAMPIAAAVGGMLFPAAIYLVFNHGNDYASGWGIPMATDIAFAIGVLSLLGNRVPLSLKVFLTALAIVDDLGAILVIALFYSTEIDFTLLIAAGAVFGLLILLNRMHVYAMKFYLIPSIVLWILFLYSGVHATIAGVLIALTIPAVPRYSKPYFIRKTRHFINEFRRGALQSAAAQNTADEAESDCRDDQSRPAARTFAAPYGSVFYHAGFRAGQRRGRVRRSRRPAYPVQFAGPRHHSRARGRKTVGHHADELSGLPPRPGQPAARCELEGPGGRGLFGRYRVYDVDFHR